ncbi:MAG: LysM domain-containing protein [Myxococcota bacterium]
MDQRSTSKRSTSIRTAIGVGVATCLLIPAWAAEAQEGDADRPGRMESDSDRIDARPVRDHGADGSDRMEPEDSRDLHRRRMGGDERLDPRPDRDPHEGADRGAIDRGPSARGGMDRGRQATGARGMNESETDERGASYVVHEGDTLGASYVVREGDTLGASYVVREGDTLGSIAKAKLGSSDQWRRLAEANDIRNPASLQVGTRIRIPSEASRRDRERDRSRRPQRERSPASPGPER